MQFDINKNKEIEKKADQNQEEIIDIYNALVEVSEEQGEQWDKINEATHIAYEGTSIKAEESYRGRARESKLKGRTLVNLASNDKVNYQHNINIIGLGENTILSSSLTRSSIKIEVKPNTYYTLKLTGDITNASVIYSKDGVNIAPLASWIIGERVINTGEADTIYINIRISENNEQFTDIAQAMNQVMLIEGNVLKESLTYFDGMQSTAEETLKDGFYHINVEASNKNLLDKYDTKLKCYKGQRLILSAIDVEEATRIRILATELDGITLNSELISATSFYKTATDAQGWLLSNNLTIIESEINILENCYIELNNSIHNYPPFKKIMIEEAREGQTESSTYVENTSNTVSIKSPILLCEGNEIDLDNSKIYENSTRIIINKWETSNFVAQENVYRMSYRIDLAKPNTTAISNYLPYISNYVLDEPHFYITSERDGLLIYVDKESIDLSNGGNTQEKINSYFSVNPLMIEYHLAEPIIHEISPLLNAIETYDDITHINTDLLIKPNIKATIPTKTTTLFDREIGALKEKDVDHSNDILKLQDEVVDISKEQGKQWDLINESTHITYEGQSITANETYNGRATGNIIEGRTLINLIEGNPANTSENNRIFYLPLSQGLDGTKSYTIKMNVSTTHKLNILYTYEEQPTSYAIIDNPTNFTLPYFINGKGNPNSIAIYMDNEFIADGGSYSINNIILLEGDYTNEDIPYFEGMKSVGEETLKDEFYHIDVVSNNKNLFSSNLELGTLTIATGEDYHLPQKVRTIDFTRIMNSSNIISCNNDVDLFVHYVFLYDINKTFIKRIDVGIKKSYIFNKVDNAEYIKIVFCNEEDSALSSEFVNEVSSGEYIQIEEAKEGQTIPSSYTKNASNIVSIKSPVLLCEGNEVDLDNSKIYENYNKIIIDGTTTITSHGIGGDITDYSISDFIVKSDAPLTGIICDKLEVAFTTTRNCIFCASGRIRVRLLTVDFPTVEEVRAFLSENPITVIYPIPTPVIHEISPSLSVIETYEEITHINTDLLIKPNIKATIPTKTTTLFDREIGALKEKDIEHSNGILKLQDEQSKISKEQGEQWKTIHDATLIDYVGEEIKAEESYRGRAESVKIKGKTVVDLEAGSMESVAENTLKDGFYTVNVEASNKNLFDVEAFKDINNHVDMPVTDGYTKGVLLKVSPNSLYTISRSTDMILDSNLCIINNVKKRYSLTGTASISRTIETDDTGILYLSVLHVTTEKIEEILNADNYQLEESEAASTYVERASNIVSIKSPVLLCEGNEIDLDNSKIYENANRIILNGSETYVRDGFNDNIVSFKLVQSISKAKNRTICNSDKLPRKVVIWSLDDEGVCTGGVDGEILIYVKKEKITSENITVTVDMFKEWLSSNPLTVEYELATPIVHEITPSLSVIETYDEITHINTDSLIKGEISTSIPTKKANINELDIAEGKLNLTTDKYQSVVMSDNTEIILPAVKEGHLVEIHLHFSTTSDLAFILPDVKWQSIPVITADKNYEFIFTYNGKTWLGGVIQYE